MLLLAKLGSKHQITEFASRLSGQCSQVGDVPIYASQLFCSSHDLNGFAGKRDLPQRSHIRLYLRHVGWVTTPTDTTNSGISPGHFVNRVF